MQPAEGAAAAMKSICEPARSVLKECPEYARGTVPQE
jgi:hypothetical protein